MIPVLELREAAYPPRAEMVLMSGAVEVGDHDDDVDWGSL